MSRLPGIESWPEWSEGRQITLWILYTLINFCKLLHVGQSRLSDVSTVRKKIRKKNWTILFDLTHYDCFLKKILKNFFQSQWQCTQWKVYLSSNFNRCPGRFCEGMGPTLRKDESCQTVQLYMLVKLLSENTTTVKCTAAHKGLESYAYIPWNSVKRKNFFSG